jgi:hypothetical protein
VLRKQSLTGGEAMSIAKKALLTSASCLAIAALVAAITVGPADARKRHSTLPAKVEDSIADPQDGEPMTLIVSLNHQKLDIYRGMTLITSSQVSTGMPGHATKAGVFSILEKQRYHHSNIYSGAPMPWMNRITWSGTALHAGVVPGYPASHGCIRLLYSFAPKLFQITTVGDTVVVARDRVAPQLIEHPFLFQPLPPASPPVMVKQEPPERQSRNDIDFLPAREASHPLVLARADIPSVTTDVPSDLEIPAVAQDRHAATPFLAPARDQGAATTSHAAPEPQAVATETGSAEDPTRVHAIDPNVISDNGGAGHPAVAVRATPVEHAALETSPALTENRTQAGTGAALNEPVVAKPPVVSTPEAKVITVSATAAEETHPIATPTMQTPPAAVVEPKEKPAVSAPGISVATTTPVTPMVAEPQAKPTTSTPAVQASQTTQPSALVTTPQATPTVSPDAPAAPAKPVVAAAVDDAPAAPEIKSRPVATPPASSEPAMPSEAVIPPAPSAKPSVIAAKLDAGASAAALEAAEPRSKSPLRILVTRGTQQDRIAAAQYVLSSMGYLEPQNFDGTLGKQTVTAIKAFQKANDMPPSGAFDDNFVTKLYAVAGKTEPSSGHIFVRQEFGRVFDAPITLRNPDQPLGTYVFTAMKFAPGDTKAQWMAVSVQGEDPAAALDRIEIPDDVRQKISERLTPGSALIIADLAINTASLPKGADFLVWAKDLPAKVTPASLSAAGSDNPRPKKPHARSVRRKNSGYTYAPAFPTTRGFPNGYPRWPW